ncbi:MAG: class III poly(R)-hydroxyalkanoic acid synthase subunit PhaE, partial [Gammaproteobacteria bacterium]|nr:class III poly(R)-hydroxyalkanoic acid synthase subunit PhaE [Gammaproteobacteria bacterium]
NRSLEMMVQGFDTGAVTDATSPAASGLWQLPLEAWQRTASMLSGLPAETLHGGAGMPLNANWAQQLERVLKTPGLGYTREFQRQYQELAQRLLAYQEAFNAYVAAYADKSGQASELVKERLQERQKSGEEPITSAKELFDLWVDCSEEVYAKFVMSDDYVHLHGQLTNAFMALKQQERVMLDDSLDAMNLPTRREMDTLHARFQQSRRNEKSLQSRLQAMQATLDDLQKHLPALAKRPTTKKKNTSKPKTRPKTKRH